jgi:hypothetical protein
MRTDLGDEPDSPRPAEATIQPHRRGAPQGCYKDAANLTVSGASLIPPSGRTSKEIRTADVYEYEMNLGLKRNLVPVLF